MLAREPELVVEWVVPHDSCDSVVIHCLLVAGAGHGFILAGIGGNDRYYGRIRIFSVFVIDDQPKHDVVAFIFDRRAGHIAHIGAIEVESRAYALASKWTYDLDCNQRFFGLLFFFIFFYNWLRHGWYRR